MEDTGTPAEGLPERVDAFVENLRAWKPRDTAAEADAKAIALYDWLVDEASALGYKGIPSKLDGEAACYTLMASAGVLQAAVGKPLSIDGVLVSLSEQQEDSGEASRPSFPEKSSKQGDM